MKNVESSIASMKNIFQNFVKYTSGIKSFCRDFCIANKTIYDKNSSFGSLANDITDCHSQIERSYEELITSVNEINLATNQWNSIFNQSKVKFQLLQNSIYKREESRKVYDHYDEKMEKLYRSRQDKIKKNASENPKDYELVTRVIIFIYRRMKKNTRKPLKNLLIYPL